MKILNWLDNRVLWEGEAATIKDAIHAAIKAKADLTSANLRSANLTIGLALEGSAKTPRRKERAAMLLERADIDQDVLQGIMTRYNLSW